MRSEENRRMGSLEVKEFFKQEGEIECTKRHRGGLRIGH